MTKLSLMSNGFRSLFHPTVYSSTRNRGLLYYSTETTQTSSSPPSSTSSSTPPTKITKKDALFKKIFPTIDVKFSIAQVLDQWAEQVETMNKSDLRGIVMKLKGLKRYKHALEVSQWMSDRKHFVLSPGDLAARLDLITKVHGIAQAEEYFDGISTQSKDSKIHNTLLICYAQKKSIKKAEALMQQMRVMGFTRSLVAYSALLKMYIQTRQYEKVDQLTKEMEEEMGVVHKHTFKMKLSAYAVTGDINNMEKTLQRMEDDPNHVMDWVSYGVAANGYIKAGMIDKALQTLQRLEELVSGREKKFVYNTLLILYGAAGKKDELQMIWNLYKSKEKVLNKAYRCMIRSLLKLDDITGAEKILNEWESGDTSYDFHIPNMLVDAYCKHGLLGKAERLVNEAMEKGKKPISHTWNILATGYVKANQAHNAVEAIKSAFLVKPPGWKPNRDTLIACLAYLKQEDDAEKMQEFVRLLGVPGHISTDDSEDVVDYVFSDEGEVAEVNKMDGELLNDDEEEEIAKEAI